MSLHDLFSPQQGHHLSNREHERTESEPWLRFKLKDSFYLVDLAHVREVSEHPEITPFPYHIDGYVGLVALGGEILPMVKPKLTPSYQPGDQLLVLAFEADKPFCISVNQVKKVMLKPGSHRIGETISIQGEAAMLVGEAHLIA